MRIAVETDRAAFRAAAADAPPGARVPVEVRTNVPDPYEAYRRARERPGGIFLETTGGQSGWGYFGVDPIERLTVGADAVVADRRGGESEDAYADYRRPSPTLSALAGVLDGERLARGECEVPYPCGAVGWLSYDVARELETLPEETADERGLPRLQAAVFDRLAAWEEPREGDVTLHVTACPAVGSSDGSDGSSDDGLDGSSDDGPDGDLDATYDAAVERARALAERALDGDPGVGPAPVDAAEARFESDCGPAAFADRVRQVKEYIRDGDTFQANVSQRLVAPAAVHPVEAYDALREVNPAPYSGLLEFARDRGDGDDPSGVDLVSASPELLLHREGRRLITEPIAGTRPRGDSPAADADYERDLLVDEKERAEHAMLVDLERNDLGKVCEYGSVEVSEYRRVDRYSEVMHLVSLVEGVAAPDVGLADALGAAFPGGTITGAPKPRTMEIIDEVERTRRGPYTGSMFVAGFDGTATANIVIRTLTRWRDEYHLRVGAGIVHDSDPDAEYEETLAKGRALVTAIDDALAAGRMQVDEPEVGDD